ncbi:MAG: hypothetical protein M1831_004446 [Alyxoria varia]|nr:MAG: hypothetical protein M1831_004446 [Alyxoria varia]
MTHLELSREDANYLHLRYYKDYGLAIEGLVRHHKLEDPLSYNREVDDALPLEKALSPDPELRKLLMEFDTSKARLWLFTNAYITHARRVVRLLGVDDLFEGITYCDYGSSKFVCKPHAAMFQLAEKDTGVSSADQCFFVDDSHLNCAAAQDRGWTACHFVESTEQPPAQQASKYRIRRLEELKDIFPEFFRVAST